jgi:hypothetical protein
LAASKEAAKEPKRPITLLPDQSPPMHLARHLRAAILAHLPDARVPPDTTAGLQRWAGDFDRMIRLDKRSPSDIRDAIDYAHAEPFWQSVILSADKVREKYDTLHAQQQNRANGHNGREHRNGHHQRPVGGGARAASGAAGGYPRIDAAYYATRFGDRTE